jgi:hypothetical protein
MRKIIQPDGSVIETIVFQRLLDMRHVFCEALRFIGYICRQGHRDALSAGERPDCRPTSLGSRELGGRKAWS